MCSVQFKTSYIRHERVLAKIYLKINTHACEFHTQTCRLLLCVEN
jgi:hypothetical protein